MARHGDREQRLGNPGFVLTGGTEQIVKRLGITTIHISMTHDAGIAIAQVVTERGDA